MRGEALSGQWGVAWQFVTEKQRGVGWVFKSVVKGPLAVCLR